MRALAALLLTLFFPALALAQNQGQGPVRSAYPLEEGTTASWMGWALMLAAIVLALLVMTRSRDRPPGHPPT